MSSQLRVRGPQKCDGMLILDGLTKVTATAIAVIPLGEDQLLIPLRQVLTLLKDVITAPRLLLAF
jgi:hypothetical protein